MDEKEALTLALSTPRSHDLIRFLEDRNPDLSTSEARYLLVKGLDSPKKCEVCQEPTKFYGHSRGYSRTCSGRCREELKKLNGSSQAAKAKAEATSLAKYGTKNPASSPKIREKINRTLIERYGFHPFQDPEFIKENSKRSRSEKHHLKIKEGMLRKYGVEHPSQIPGHTEKVRNTLLSKYGVGGTRSIPSVKEKTRVDQWERIQGDGCVITGTRDSDSILPSACKIIEFNCLKCGEASEQPYETFKWRVRRLDTPCRKCNPSTRSIGEREVYDFVNSLLPGVISNSRSAISPYELDIYVPDKKVAIEYHGLYWHSEASGTYPNYHLDKLKRCESAGIRLIQVFEDEWRDNRKLCERMIRSALGECDLPKIGARKCIVDNSVKVPEARKFCEENHLQGYGNSSYRYGLRLLTGELVALMTFSRPSKAKGGGSGWELNRYSTSARVVGGGSRLLSAFRKDFSEEIFSFCDRRWGTGNLYREIGMEEGVPTQPGYWYTDGHSRIHRYALRKSVLVDMGGSSDKTEMELAEEAGFIRIYDAGHLKFSMPSS